jgi:thioredoxin-related protein
LLSGSRLSPQVSHLVRVLPRADSKAKECNAELVQKFGVLGFPTLILLNSKGEEAARKVGYLEGGPEGIEQMPK